MSSFLTDGRFTMTCLQRLFHFGRWIVWLIGIVSDNLCLPPPSSLPQTRAACSTTNNPLCIDFVLAAVSLCTHCNHCLVSSLCHASLDSAHSALFSHHFSQYQTVLLLCLLGGTTPYCPLLPTWASYGVSYTVHPVTRYAGCLGGDSYR